MATSIKYKKQTITTDRPILEPTFSFGNLEKEENHVLVNLNLICLDRILHLDHFVQVLRHEAHFYTLATLIVAELDFKGLLLQNGGMDVTLITRPIFQSC